MSDVYTAEGLAKKMGVSYRQLDYWVTSGFLGQSRVNGERADSNPGTGNIRVWTGRDVQAAMWFGRLVAAGFKPSAIGTMHQQLAEGRTVHLAHGLRLSVAGACPGQP